MTITILGSGGFKATPQPLCHCSLCRHARRNPSSRRTGPSVYFHDLNLLIDLSRESPEHIEAIGRFPDYILLSHWHPDHTEGYRVLESFPHPPRVIIPVSSMILDRLPALSFLASQKIIHLKQWSIGSPLRIKGWSVNALLFTKEIPAYAYRFTNQKKDMVICMDHAKYLLETKLRLPLDLLIMNMGTPDETKKSITRWSDTIAIINRLRPTRTVLMHIEEHFQLTSLRRHALQRSIGGHIVEFAVDGTEVIM